MQQHTIHFWTHLEQEGGEAVLRGQICYQTMSSKSGILWIYGAFKTTGDSEGGIMMFVIFRSEL